MSAMSDMPRSPLTELQTPASLSIRSPVKAPSSSVKVTATDEEQLNENCPPKFKTSNQEQDKYSFIASLDDQLDDVKWEERTTVITAMDHQAYLASGHC